MQQLHVIVGSTGEYSDRNEFLIEAHTSKDAAQERVKQLDAAFIAFKERDWDQTYNPALYRAGADAKLAEANAKAGITVSYVDYTGISFYISECPLVA